MGRKAGHHFIPSSYLAGFTAEQSRTGRLWCVPKNNRPAFPTNPLGSCKERDYHTHEGQNPLLIEDWYGEQIEPELKRTIDSINKNGLLPSSSEFETLCLLVATLLLRPPKWRQRLTDAFKRDQEIAASMAQDPHISNWAKFPSLQTKAIESEVRAILPIAESLSRKYWQLYLSKEPTQHFVTSDNPVVVTPPSDRPGDNFGIDTKGVEICVPISRSALLLGRNEPIETGAAQANAALVGLANTKIILSAQRFFYLSCEQVHLVDNELNAYVHRITP